MGHHPRKTIIENIAEPCHKCKRLTAMGHEGDESTDGTGQSDEPTEESTAREETSKDGNIGKETWYIEKRIVKNTNIFTNLDHFGSESLRPKKKRQRRESQEY